MLCSPGEGSKQLTDNEGEEMYDDPLVFKSSMQLPNNTCWGISKQHYFNQANRWADGVHRGHKPMTNSVLEYLVSNKKCLFSMKFVL